MKGIGLGDMSSLAIVFVITAVIIGIGGTILQSTATNACTDGLWNATSNNCNVGKQSIASNATLQGLSGTNTLATWLPTIAVIVAAAVVIGIIVNSFRTEPA